MKEGMKAELKEIFSEGEGLQLHLEIQDALDQLADLTVPQVGLLLPKLVNIRPDVNNAPQTETLIDEPQIDALVAKVDGLLKRVIELAEKNGITFTEENSNVFQEGALLTAAMETKASKSAMETLVKRVKLPPELADLEVSRTADHLYSQVLLLSRLDKTEMDDFETKACVFFRRKFGLMFRVLKARKEEGKKKP